MAEIPSCSDARHNKSASPTGSAAAVRSSRCVSAGSDRSCRWKLCSRRFASGCVSGRPNPPASSAAVNPRVNSTNASGFPRVSATILSRTRSSSRPGATDSSNARASASLKPVTTSSGSPVSSRSSWAHAARKPWRPIPLGGGARRTRVPAQKPGRATGRHRPGRQEAVPQPPRRAARAPRG